MSDYDLKRQRVSTLRKLVIHSADSLPAEVAAYLEEVTKNPRGWQEKEQLLKEYRPLAEHLPAAFVDFALNYLVEGRRAREEYWMDGDPGRLGIQWVKEYHPAAPVQGPFLYLLRRHEREGLRLVHGLVNAATTRWRESELRGRFGRGPRRAVPLRLALPRGERVFWGDDTIYRWYRGTAVGPDAVVSALMALELWVEEQLAAERDAAELFSTVLECSESVAILGVIVSAALARPGSALDLLLPLIGNARIWHMDVMRLLHDGTGTPVIDFLRTNEAINRLLSERNRLPQRRHDIRALLPLYLFDETRKESIAELVRDFGDPLPFEFEEEGTDGAEVEKRSGQIADFRPFLDKGNYRASRNAEGRSCVEYVPPEEVLNRDRVEREARARIAAALPLKMWARTSLDQGSLVAGMSASEAICAAQALQEEGDFEEPSSIETDGLDHARLEAIAEVAAAVLTASPWQQLKVDELTWLRSVLLAAAHAPRAGLVIPESHYPSELKVSAALGLGALVTAGEKDQEVRESLLLLSGNAEHQVVAAVIRGLHDAWAFDPALCWNCLSLAISFCCVPRSAVIPFSGLTLNDSGKDWVQGVWESHFRQLRDGVIPDLPRVEPGEDMLFRSDRMVDVLGPIPLLALGEEPEGKRRLIQFHGDLMARTLAPEAEEEDGHRHSVSDYQWEGNFLRWSARVATILSPEEEQMHVIRPVLATWPGRSRLLRSLLEGFLRERFASLAPLPEQAVAAWERIWDALLGTPDLKSRSRWPDSSSRDEELDTLAVFVAYGRCFFQESWPHASRFETLIDRWVRTVGVKHHCYHALVTMLKPNVDRFSAETILGWLRHVLGSSPDVRALMKAHDNGTRTVQLLSILRAKGLESLTRGGLMPALATIVDALVAGGVSAAGLLQREIEGRG